MPVSLIGLDWGYIVDLRCDNGLRNYFSDLSWLSVGLVSLIGLNWSYIIGSWCVSFSVLFSSKSDFSCRGMVMDSSSRLVLNISRDTNISS